MEKVVRRVKDLSEGVIRVSSKTVNNEKNKSNIRK